MVLTNDYRKLKKKLFFMEFCTHDCETCEFNVKAGSGCAVTIFSACLQKRINNVDTSGYKIKEAV
jgi:hypothetical protein